MARVLETPRLVLDTFQPRRDAPFMLELLNDPSFISNIRDSGVRTRADAARYLEEGPVASYARFGFGLWRVTLRAAQAPIGMCGLLKRNELPDPDLGFAYLERHQGRGYGREAAAAVLAHARAQLGLSRILAIAATHNLGSARLLLGLGFREDDADPSGQDARLFVNDG